VVLQRRIKILKEIIKAEEITVKIDGAKKCPLRFDSARQGDRASMSQFSAIFANFSAKKLVFFSKTNVMIKILHNLALFLVKNANFLLNYIIKKS
jgi:hypothetical protein